MDLYELGWCDPILRHSTRRACQSQTQGWQMVVCRVTSLRAELRRLVCVPESLQKVDGIYVGGN